MTASVSECVCVCAKNKEYVSLDIADALAVSAIGFVVCENKTETRAFVASPKLCNEYC